MKESNKSIELLTKIVLLTAEEYDFYALTNRYDSVLLLLRQNMSLLGKFGFDWSLDSIPIVTIRIPSSGDIAYEIEKKLDSNQNPDYRVTPN
jgi:hypothetical protein